jgi:predicted NAD/FAD-dependent oxidoreductase
VVGGSIGGLTAALRLRDAGWEVDVFERSAVLFRKTTFRAADRRSNSNSHRPSTARPMLSAADTPPHGSWVADSIYNLWVDPAAAGWKPPREQEPCAHFGQLGKITLLGEARKH